MAKPKEEEEKKFKQISGVRLTIPCVSAFHCELHERAVEKARYVTNTRLVTDVNFISV